MSLSQYDGEEDMSLSEVQDVLRRTHRQAAPEERWPEYYRDVIKDAVENQLEEVTLEGRLFLIKYHTEGTRFFLKPERGFAPCGWFNREWVYDVAEV